MDREPFPRRTWWSNSEHAATTAALSFILLALGLSMLGLYVPWGWTPAPLLLPLTIWYPVSRHFRDEVETTRYVHYDVYNTTRLFEIQWDRLTRELKIELSDVYRAVVRLDEAASSLSANALSDSPVMLQIRERTDLIRDVADEWEYTRAVEMVSSAAAHDDHAIETAKLYIKSFKQQREKS